jgi:hypothetical protein
MRNLKKRDVAISRLRDIYSRAISFGSTHEVILADLADMRKAIAKCPTWVKSYVEGYDKALHDSLYLNGHLIYGGIVNGTFYSTHSSRADYYGKHGIDPAAYADNGLVSNRGHYWNPDAHKGITKPFSISPSSN